ncbi:hypothetical protein [Costertonia aggregata]|uniref:Uncharacterized protein n=1 Tax=Costertonia aggregata TaxID=343403 RepID=A0A7H9ATQ4_9FLAO|nr:hypothetical protein [Costertonia aggregata]QLG46820.1 hypothetical protein HYG79_16165 [Costertonia aggregata]
MDFIKANFKFYTKLQVKLLKIVRIQPYRICLVLIITTLVCPLFGKAQDNTVSNKKLYTIFDDVTGSENTALYNGILFIDEYKVINDKHRFWSSPDFIIGEIKYDNQMFFEQRLKYDLFEDEVLTSPENTSSALLLQLRKSKVDQFVLEGHKFLRIHGDSGTKRIDLGFCELLAEENSIFLLKKIRKYKSEKKNTEFRYNEFYESEDYYIKQNENIYPVNTKKEWILSFSNSKKLIKNFFKDYYRLRKINKDSFTKLIFDQITSQPSTEMSLKEL